MNVTDASKPVTDVIIGTDEPYVSEAVRMMMTSSFGGGREVRCTVKSGVQEIRRAVSLYEFDVVFLFTDTMKPDGGGDRFEQVIELVGELRKALKRMRERGRTWSPASCGLAQARCFCSGCQTYLLA